MAAVGSIAYAAIPREDGTIDACYKNTGGALRVIDGEAGVTCNSSETAIEWNAEGPQGPSGVSGYEIVHRTGSVTISGSSGPAGSSVLCPEGKVVVGGGGSASFIGGGEPFTNADMAASGWTDDPSPEPTDRVGWQVSFVKPDGSDWTGQTLTTNVHAICVSITD